ncbi:DevC protein [Chondrocystis sp. NIES-4102]|nr:DevC protein [Chondrocystis sp. NIES-4102]
MFNKLFTAWLQLKYQKIRLILALSGVIFAVVIVFMQLGIRDALFDSAVRFHKSLDGDCFIISPRSTSLIAMENFPNRRLAQALAFEEVDHVSPIYLDFAQWKNPESRKYWRNIFVIGFDLRDQVFTLPGVNENRQKLQLPDTILFDRSSRTEFGPIAQQFTTYGKAKTEIGSNSGSNRRVDVVGLFDLGTSFGSDGNIITSEVNFLRLVDTRAKGRIDVGLIKLTPGTDPNQFKQKLVQKLPRDIKILTKQEFIQFEKKYWQSSTAIGFIFNLGVFLGLIVGVVVVYQILYTNVSDHLPQYATLKAIGYTQNYLLSIVFQQALFIGALGYLPGLIISIIQYQFAAKMTLLPIIMTWQRAVFVLVTTLIMCLISGFSAMNKLKSANPADVF